MLQIAVGNTGANNNSNNKQEETFGLPPRYFDPPCESTIDKQCEKRVMGYRDLKAKQDAQLLQVTRKLQSMCHDCDSRLNHQFHERDAKLQEKYYNRYSKTAARYHFDFRGLQSQCHDATTTDSKSLQSRYDKMYAGLCDHYTNQKASLRQETEQLHSALRCEKDKLRRLLRDHVFQLRMSYSDQREKLRVQGITRTNEGQCADLVEPPSKQGGITYEDPKAAPKADVVGECGGKEEACHPDHHHHHHDLHIQSVSPLTDYSHDNHPPGVGELSQPPTASSPPHPQQQWQQQLDSSTPELLPAGHIISQSTRRTSTRPSLHVDTSFSSTSCITKLPPHKNPQAQQDHSKGAGLPGGVSEGITMWKMDRPCHFATLDEGNDSMRSAAISDPAEQFSQYCADLLSSLLLEARKEGQPHPSTGAPFSDHHHPTPIY